MAKTRKALFLDVSESSVLAARTSATEPPLVIEALREAPLGSADELATMVAEMMSLPKGQYAHSVVGVYPKGRFVRRASLENPAKAKDPAFLAEYVQQQFQVEVSKNMVAVLNAEAGAFLSAETGFTKELVFCGAPLEELRDLQKFVVGAGVYPQRLEVGTVATLGGLGNYLNDEEIKTPTLLLELTQENALVFILRGTQMDLSRSIPIGIKSMIPVVQQELALKDEESARKLFYSNTFDFTDIGPTLLKRILKDVQSSTGFYEVQTGQTIGQIHLSLLPKSLGWMSTLLAHTLGVEPLKVEFPNWLRGLGIQAAQGVELNGLDSRWLGLFSLMAKYETKGEAKPDAKPEAA